jgi:hypothetical protein
MTRAQLLTRSLVPIFSASVWLLFTVGIAATFAHRLQTYFLPALVLFGASYMLLVVAAVIERVSGQPAPKVCPQKSAKVR